MNRPLSAGAFLRRDFARYRPAVTYSPFRILCAAATNPGLLALVFLRLQMAAVSRGRDRTAGIIRLVALVMTGADFVPGCVAGPGLLMHHPSGVVLGGGAVLGDDCTILQQVTLGERYADGRGPHSYPRVGDRCTLGAGARLIGGITVASDCNVGANSVVLADVPRGATVVGAPARVIGRNV